MTRPSRFQFVWWHLGRGVWGFKRPDPSNTDIALIYRWFLCLGPLEVRRWR
jgi:hypothetical protein